MQYCPDCGALLSLKEIELEGAIPYCNNCKKLFFPYSFPCVICVISYHNKLLLIKQNYVCNGYCLVAGHIKEKQTIEETVIAEIKEEVNLDVCSLRYVKSFYHEKGNNLMIGFFVKAKGEIKINSEVDSFYLASKEEALKLLDERITAKSLLKCCIEEGLISE